MIRLRFPPSLSSPAQLPSVPDVRSSVCETSCAPRLSRLVKKKRQDSASSFISSISATNATPPLLLASTTSSSDPVVVWSTLISLPSPQSTLSGLVSSIANIPQTPQTHPDEVLLLQQPVNFKPQEGKASNNTPYTRHVADLMRRKSPSDLSTSSPSVESFARLARSVTSSAPASVTSKATVSALNPVLSMSADHPMSQIDAYQPVMELLLQNEFQRQENAASATTMPATVTVKPTKKSARISVTSSVCKKTKKVVFQPSANIGTFFKSDPPSKRSATHISTVVVDNESSCNWKKLMAAKTESLVTCRLTKASLDNFIRVDIHKAAGSCSKVKLKKGDFATLLPNRYVNDNVRI